MFVDVVANTMVAVAKNILYKKKNITRPSFLKEKRRQLIVPPRSEHDNVRPLFRLQAFRLSQKEVPNTPRSLLGRLSKQAPGAINKPGEQGGLMGVSVQCGSDASLSSSPGINVILSNDFHPNYHTL